MMAVMKPRPALLALIGAALSLTACSSTTASLTGDAVFDACYRALAGTDQGTPPPPDAEIAAVWRCQYSGGPQSPIVLSKAIGATDGIIAQLIAGPATAEGPSPSACPAIAQPPTRFVTTTPDMTVFVVPEYLQPCGAWQPSDDVYAAAEFEATSSYTPSP